MKFADCNDVPQMAPCGVSCFACSAYLAEKKRCPGCHAREEEITRKSCRHCAKKACARERGLAWCFLCEKFPCARLKTLAKRYREHYDIDLIAEGELARERGVEALREQRRRRYTCHCGGIIDQHHSLCSECGKKA